MAQDWGDDACTLNIDTELLGEGCWKGADLCVDNISEYDDMDEISIRWKEENVKYTVVHSFHVTWFFRFLGHCILIKWIKILRLYQ